MMFWKVMMKVPDGTPRISLVAETATRRSKWRIWKEKVMQEENSESGKFHSVKASL